MPTRKKKRSFNESSEERRLKHLEKKKADQEKTKQLKQAIKQKQAEAIKAAQKRIKELKLAAKATKAKTGKKKKVKKLSPEQLELRREARKLYKENPVEYFRLKNVKKNEARQHKKIVARAKRIRQIRKAREGKADKFNCAKGFMKIYNNEQTCIDKYLERAQILSLNKDGKPTCPYCNRETKVYAYHSREIFKCTRCNHQYRLTTGTPLYKMKLSMDDFFLLLLQEIIAKNGMTVEAGVLQIGGTMKTSFLNLNKIRGSAFAQGKNSRGQEAFPIKSKRPVSVDTTGVYGKNENRHDYNKFSREELYQMATQVGVGRERFGNTFATVVDNLGKDAMEDMIKDKIPAGSEIYTDEHASFKGLAKIEGKNYTHETTNHSAGEHARGKVTTNPVEGANAEIKKVMGAHYNHFSRKGLQLQLNAMTFKANASACGLTLAERFTLALDNIILRRQPKARVILFRPSISKQYAIVA